MHIKGRIVENFATKDGMQLKKPFKQKLHIVDGILLTKPPKLFILCNEHFEYTWENKTTLSLNKPI